MAITSETKDVFSRTVADSPGQQVSAGVYNLIIGLTLCWGFLVNWWMIQTIPVASIMAIDMRLFLLGYFVSCFFGIYLFTKSSNPVVSFIGYNFVVVPFGLIVNLVVSRYSPTIVLDAVRVTGLVTLIMMVLGSMYPNFFSKIVGGLTIALFAVIIVELVEMFIFHRDHTITDWIVALLFCGYIGYDWARANAIPKTVDNAIDSAAALYMDIINLFLRILRILGRKD